MNLSGYKTSCLAAHLGKVLNHMVRVRVRCRVRCSFRFRAKERATTF